MASCHSWSRRIIPITLLITVKVTFCPIHQIKLSSCHTQLSFFLSGRQKKVLCIRSKRGVEFYKLGIYFGPLGVDFRIWESIWAAERRSWASDSKFWNSGSTLGHSESIWVFQSTSGASGSRFFGLWGSMLGLYESTLDFQSRFVSFGNHFRPPRVDFGVWKSILCL